MDRIASNERATPDVPEREGFDGPQTGHSRRESTDDDQIYVLLVGSVGVLKDRAALDGPGFVTVEAATEEAALSTVEGQRVDCVVVTDEGHERGPVAVLSAIRERDEELPVVLVAASGSERLASKAISAGVTEYVPAETLTEGDGLTAILEENVEPSRSSTSSPPVDSIEAAVEHAADAVLVTDSDGVIEYVNPAFEELTGYERSEALGRTPRILKSGKQGQSYYEQMWSAILRGEVWEETIVNETRSGEKYTAHQTVAPVTDDDGQVRRFVGIQRDITRQQRLEEQLERSEATLSRLYDLTTNPEAAVEEKIERALTVGARHLDYETGYFTRIADGEQEILAVAGESGPLEIGRTDPLERTYCQQTIERKQPYVLPDAAEGPPEVQEAHETFGLRCYLGARVVVNGSVYGTLCFGSRSPRDELILDAHQSTIKTLANWIGYEIEREQYERKLERQNERLETFASAVSHDLRNPLNVAQAHAKLVADDTAGDDDTTDDGSHTEKIRAAHERMETIIDETLTLARQGKLVEQPSECSLEAVATECWETVETGDATLCVEDDCTLRADEDRLRHIFENLFRNAVEHGSTSPASQQDAVKHSSTGSQHPADDAVEHGDSAQSHTAEDASDHGDSLTIRVGTMADGFYVEDDGRGFGEGDTEQLFEYGHSPAGGSGFGLSIVKAVANAHDWSVRATDSADGGARFEFEFDGSPERCLVC